MKYIVITSTPEGFPPEWVREFWVGIKIPLMKQEDGLFADDGPFNREPVYGTIYPNASMFVHAYDALEALYADETTPERVKKWYKQNGHVYTEDSRGKKEARWSFHKKYCDLIVE